MSNWLNILNHLRHKQASYAPNYSRAKDPNHSCMACAFYNEENSHCTRYDFHADPSYWCSSWEPEDLNISEKVASMLKSIKEASMNGQSLNYISPSQVVSPGTPDSLPPIPGIRMPGFGQIRGNHPETKSNKVPLNLLPINANSASPMKPPMPPMLQSGNMLQNPSPLKS